MEDAKGARTMYDKCVTVLSPRFSYKYLIINNLLYLAFFWMQLFVRRSAHLEAPCATDRQVIWGRRILGYDSL
jgi:hypothetical protein